MIASRTRMVLRTAVAASLCTVPIAALAGPIGAINAIFMAFYVVAAVVIGLALLGLVLCRFIPDRRTRAIARLSIVLLVATPVPIAGGYGTSSFVPALIAALTHMVGVTQPGLFAHSLLVAYVVSFAAFAPLVLAWQRLGERYYGRR